MNDVTIVTHSGRFHADDVFAVATLFLFLRHSDFPAWRNKEIDVVRTRDEQKINEAEFVVDVGGIYNEENNRFDHHQIGGAGARPNGIPYAGFGLVWKKFGEKVCGSKAVAEMIDTKLVQSIDAQDNGFKTFQSVIPGADPYLVDDFVFSFHPTWKELPDGFDATFLELVEIARTLLEREIKIAQAKEEAIVLVNEAYAAAQDKRIVILDQYLPWKDVLVSYSEPLYAIYPVKEENTWHVGAVTQGVGKTFKNRKDLPKAWAGKRDQELVRASGVKDAIFCHNKLFMAVAQTKEGAIELAKKALEA